mmetsp:Transcript_42261/g.99206  ORF Transcript_42261/g.99206 Transcript_42261/m.99206 type:complete len:239 (-) Transcript_42261:733-1449(-)
MRGDGVEVGDVHPGLHHVGQDPAQPDIARDVSVSAVPAAPVEHCLLLPQRTAARRLGEGGFDKEVDRTVRRVVVGSFARAIAVGAVAVDVTLTGRVPRRGIRPVLHPPSHRVDDLVEGSDLVVAVAVELADKVAHHLGQRRHPGVVCRRVLVRGAAVDVIAPGVGDHVVAAVEGGRELEEIGLPELVDALRGHCLHALRRRLVPSKVPVRVDPELFARVGIVADGISCRHDRDDTRVQ